MWGIIAAVLVFLYLNGRIGELEDRLNKTSSPKVPEPKRTEPAVSISSATSVTSVTPVVPAATATPSPESAWKFPQRAAVNPVKKDSTGTEFAVGSKLLTGVGIFAVFLGIIFFLRYAFENNLITETMRVVLGVGLGVVMGGIGHFLKKKYVTYGLTLVGGGLGVIFLSIYAAYAFYGLIPTHQAFFVLSVVMVLGVGLSLFYNSLVLIAYSLLGAFLIPLILPLTLSVHILFGYLLILNIAVILIAKYRTWPLLPIGSLLATSLVALRWVVSPYAGSLFAVTCTYLTIIFLMYLATTIIHYNREAKASQVDASMLYLVPIIYVTLVGSMMHGAESFAILMLSVGAVYALMGTVLQVLHGGKAGLQTLSTSFVSIASIAVAAGIALYFHGTVIGVLWAAEAALLLVLGAILKSHWHRRIGVVLAVLTAIRTLVFDLSVNFDASPIFNERTLMLVITAVPFLIMWFTYKHYVSAGEMDESEQKTGLYLGSMGVWALGLTGVTVEILDFVKIEAYLYLPIAWSLYAIFWMAVTEFLPEKQLRYCSYALLGTTAVTIITTQWSLRDYVLVANIRALSVAVFVATLATVVFMLRKNKEQMLESDKTVVAYCFAGIYLFILWLISLEVLDFYNEQIKAVGRGFELSVTLENTKRVVLSAAWLVYALGSLAVGIIYRSSVVRYFSITLFLITIVKIFLYDTSNLSDIYRFMSFILLGVILLMAGFAYYRFKDRIMQFVSAK